MLHHCLSPLLFIGLLVLESAIGGEYRIKSQNDFVTFLDNVNNRGTNYASTTVYLECDLSLPDITTPIGNPSNYFQGTFDGQGYVISDISISSSTSSLNHVGLFGYSEGLTIQNVVIDGSCSFVNTYITQYLTSLGSIIGYCQGSKGECNIKNSVNMANVTFDGDIGTSYQLHLGGIVGYSKMNGYSSIIENCANYGNVIHSGNSGGSYIGGIVGYSEGTSSYRVNINNCLNYGAIIHSGTTSKYYLYIGGITGQAKNTRAENCMSAGGITSSQASDNIGSIVGYAANNIYVEITHCFWTSDVGYDNSCGYGNPTIINSTQVELNSTSLRELNGYSTSNLWNSWILNSNSASISFKINNGKIFTIKSKIILLPNPVNSERIFGGWYTDNAMAIKFTPTEVSSDITLYGDFCGSNITVTLDVNGGNELLIKTMSIGCDRLYGELPNATRTKATFGGWFTEDVGGVEVKTGERVVNLTSHTLYAHWIDNMCTVKFVFNNGSDPENRILESGKKVVFPVNPKREGYTFIGWFNENNECVTEETIVNFSSVYILYAQWIPNNYTIIFDFGNGTNVENTLHFNDVIIHPENVIKEGYTFNGWNSDTEYMPAHNLTITAHWTPNNYTVILNVNGGDELNNNIITIKFNSTYGPLPTPNRTGYTFVGWFNEKNNERITSNTIVSIADNYTLIAQWADNMNCVEIIFETKDLTEKEVKEIIRKYADNDKFEIIKFENSESGETKVIIKFTDVETAENFAETIRESSDMKKVVKSVNFVFGEVRSFSLMLYPTTVYGFFLI